MNNNGNFTTHYEDLLRMLAKSHIEGIRRGYQQGYQDGYKDGVAKERKRMNPIVSDGTRHGSSLSASELRSRRTG